MGHSYPLFEIKAGYSSVADGWSWQQQGDLSARLANSKSRYSSPLHLASDLYPQVTSHVDSWHLRDKPGAGLSLPTSPGLALPDEKGPSTVSRQQQQFLRFLPAQTLIQPPGGEGKGEQESPWGWMGQNSKGTRPPSLGLTVPPVP